MFRDIIRFFPVFSRLLTGNRIPPYGRFTSSGREFCFPHVHWSHSRLRRESGTSSVALSRIRKASPEPSGFQAGRVVNDAGKQCSVSMCRFSASRPLFLRNQSLSSPRGPSQDREARQFKPHQAANFLLGLHLVVEAIELSVAVHGEAEEPLVQLSHLSTSSCESGRSSCSMNSPIELVKAEVL